VIEGAELGTFDVMVLAILARFTWRWYGGLRRTILWRTILWDLLLCMILLEDNDDAPALPASGLDTCGEAHRMIVPQPMAQVAFQAERDVHTLYVTCRAITNDTDQAPSIGRHGSVLRLLSSAIAAPLSAIPGKERCTEHVHSHSSCSSNTLPSERTTCIPLRVVVLPCESWHGPNSDVAGVARSEWTGPT
jgi:hypothetical protein